MNQDKPTTISSGPVDLKSTKPKNPGGRGRKIQLDTKIIENLASIHCTNREIAEVMGVSVDTLQRNFPQYLKKGKAQGKVKLRRAQWSAAEKGNPTMLIWLGKQLLNQSDQPQDGDNNQPLPFHDLEPEVDKPHTDSVS